MNLSIIIVTYNTNKLLRECLGRIRKSKDNLEKEVIVIDNASCDGTVAMVRKEFPEVILIENSKNEGFARANIKGERLAKGKYILLLNTDAFIKEYTLQKVIDFMEKNHECGILGCRIIFQDGSIQFSAKYFPTPWRYFVMHAGLDKRFNFLKGLDDVRKQELEPRVVDWVPGCFFLIRRQTIDEIGFLREDYFMYGEDVDFCLRAKKKGWQTFFYPGTKIIHLKSASSIRKNSLSKSRLYFEKLMLQSEYIYFRKNYNILYVLLDVLFIVLFDISEILKKIILRKKKISISVKIKHMCLALKTLALTKFGEISND